MFMKLQVIFVSLLIPAVVALAVINDIEEYAGNQWYVDCSYGASWKSKMDA